MCAGFQRTFHFSRSPRASCSASLGQRMRPTRCGSARRKQYRGPSSRSISASAGSFAKYGLDVEIFDLAGDAKVQQALAADSIDIGLGSGPGLAFVPKGGASMGVAAFAGAPRNISVIVLNNSPIKSVADSKGKLVSVSTVGSLSDSLRANQPRRGLGAGRHPHRGARRHRYEHRGTQGRAARRRQPCD